MTKKIIAIAFLLVLVRFAIAQNSRLSDSPLRKLQMAEFAISNLYVDSVNEKKLVEDAIQGMLTQLDPHSTYATAEEVKKLNEPLQGNFEGIGVQFNMAQDTLLIIQPVSNGPSEKVGIMAGDRIITVNDSIIAGVKMSTEDIMGRLRGAKGTTVKLGILRRGIKDMLYFTVVRDKIPVHSLDASYIIKPGIGYIRINSFGATTSKEFDQAITLLQKKGMKDLILDLQGNGGGYLNAAIDLANEFLSQHSLIVYTEGTRSPKSQFFAQGNGKLQQGKLIVLTDDYTASAAEIVTGAIQDWDRGLVVGRRTFGKGLVQRPIDLPDGSMIRLTIARYYTPSGRCIQKPYTKGKEEDYEMDLINRYNKGQMIHADSIHFPKSQKFKTKRLERIVYGGGGVMPDYFVPLDTTKYTNYHRQLVAKGAVINTNLKYVDAHRKEIKVKYKSFEDFDAHFIVPEEMLKELIKAGEDSGVKFNEKEYLRSKEMLMLQLKALVARDIWDMNEYFRVINKEDSCINKALELTLSKNFDELMMKNK